ncbi:MAG: YceI family protein [Thermoanaerobaculia bacterium]
MSHRIRSFAGALVLVLVAAAPVAADQDFAKKFYNARESFTELMESPDRGVPAWLLERTHCIAVIPSVIKGAFIWGGRHGRCGVMSCRDEQGTWSPPIFVKLSGGNFGFQAAARRRISVLFFQTERGVRSLLDSKFVLGADVGLAAGPLGRSAEATTDLKFRPRSAPTPSRRDRTAASRSRAPGWRRTTRGRAATTASASGQTRCSSATRSPPPDPGRRGVPGRPALSGRRRRQRPHVAARYRPGAAPRTGPVRHPYPIRGSAAEPLTPDSRRFREMRRTIPFAALVLIAAVAHGRATYEIDPAHSAASFTVTHLTVSKVRGSFHTIAGTAQVDEENLADSSIEVTIDAASIDTGVDRRDNHLRSADFFDVENHPRSPSGAPRSRSSATPSIR